jgi:hypothetical protein
MHYFTGDTHGEIQRINEIKEFCVTHKVTDNDILFILGDFGFIFDCVESYREWYCLEEITGLPFKYVFFIDGNHENFPRLDEFPVTALYGGRCHKLTPKVYHMIRGEVFDIEGKIYTVMGGGASIDKAWRVKDLSWWETEMPSYDVLSDWYTRLLEIQQPFYILTHECPRDIMNQIIIPSADDPYLTTLKDFFQIVLDNFDDRILKWYFGHMHIDKTFRRHSDKGYSRRFIGLYEGIDCVDTEITMC